MPSPIPSEHPSRERDARRRHGAKVATVSGTDNSPTGPTLAKLTGRRDWPRPVRDWFESWRRSPQARLFVSDVEWQQLGRAAYLLEAFHAADTPASVRVQCHTAVRNMEASLGATHTDRVKTHMKIKPAVDEPAAPSAGVVDYRARLA